MLNCETPIRAINESHLNPNICFTGSPDGKIQIWDFKYAELKRTIDQHKSGVSSLILFENPLGSEDLDDYLILSFGEQKGDVVISQPKTEKIFELMFSMETEFDKETTKYPRIQLFKRGGNAAEDGVGLVTFSNHGEKKCLIFMNFNN